MNIENFEKRISHALDHYGKLGVKTEILGVSTLQTEHGEWTSVLVAVTVMNEGLTRYAEEWRFGGVATHEKLPIPYGIRGIDRRRLIGVGRAAEMLPPGFPLDHADCTLYWALSPSCTEPEYHFRFEDVVIAIGAYTGHHRRG